MQRGGKEHNGRRKHPFHTHTHPHTPTPEQPQEQLLKPNWYDRRQQNGGGYVKFRYTARRFTEHERNLRKRMGIGQQSTYWAVELDRNQWRRHQCLHPRQPTSESQQHQSGHQSEHQEVLGTYPGSELEAAVAPEREPNNLNRAEEKVEEHNQDNPTNTRRQGGGAG